MQRIPHILYREVMVKLEHVKSLYFKILNESHGKKYDLRRPT